MAEGTLSRASSPTFRSLVVWRCDGHDRGTDFQQPGTHVGGHRGHHAAHRLSDLRARVSRCRSRPCGSTWWSARWVSLSPSSGHCWWPRRRRGWGWMLPRCSSGRACASPRRRLTPGLMKLAFLFLLVGYGTKAGLAPLHSWLPDAHSQAPAPVSALFSGFMLNTALYCVMRYLPLVEEATGGVGWGGGLLVGFGITLHPGGGGFHRVSARRQASARLPQRGAHGHHRAGAGARRGWDLRRTWHTLNHAVCKSLAFFSMRASSGRCTAPTTSARWPGPCADRRCGASASLAGCWCSSVSPPFAIFMSEFQILRAAAAAPGVHGPGPLSARRRHRVRRRAAARDD